MATADHCETLRAFKKTDPGTVVTVCFPALIKSASSSPSNGNGPIPGAHFHSVEQLRRPLNVVDQRRHTNAEVDVVSVFQLSCDTLSDLFSGQ